MSSTDKVNCYDYYHWDDSNHVTSCKDCPSKKDSCSGDCKWDSSGNQCINKTGKLIHHYFNFLKNSKRFNFLLQMKTVLKKVTKTCLKKVMKTVLEKVMKTCLMKVLKTVLKKVMKIVLRKLMKIVLKKVMETVLKKVMREVMIQVKK